MALGGNIVKRVELKITADDGDTQAKLDAIHAKAEELAREHPEIKVRIDAAEASAKMAVLRKELRDTAKSADDTRDHVGIFSSLLHGNFSQAISGVTSLISGAGGGGGLLGALGSLANPVLAGVGIAAAGVAAILAGPLIAGLFAVGASIGSLALFAIPDFTKIWDAIGKGPKAIAALPGPMRAVADQAEGLIKGFDQISKAVMPSVMQTFASALRLVKDLMPSLQPLAIGAAKAFTGLFNDISRWLTGGSGQKFLHWLDTEGPAAMMRFTHFLWDMANVVGRAFSYMRNQGNDWDSNFKKNVNDSKTGWSSMSQASNQGASTQKSAWSLIVQAGFQGSAQLRNAWNIIVTAGLMGSRAVLGETISVAKAFANMDSLIISTLEALPGELFHIGEMAVEGLINGLKSMAGQVMSVGSWLGNLVTSALHIHLHVGSPSKLTYQYGQWVGEGLALGIESKVSRVSAAATRIAHAAAAGSMAGQLGASGASAAGGGNQPIVFEVHPSGSGLDHLFMTWLANAIRAKGGDPRILVRKVEFA